MMLNTYPWCLNLNQQCQSEKKNKLGYLVNKQNPASELLLNASHLV